MADYEPLDLSLLCNVGIEVLPPAAKPLIGEQMLHGLPFLIGSPTENGNSCFVGLGPGLHEGPLRVETGADVLEVVPLEENGRITRARATMGVPRFYASDIPVLIPRGEPALHVGTALLNTISKSDYDLGQLVVRYPVTVDGHEFRLTCVSMGNPHAVAFIDEPVDEVPLHLLGPLVEHHPLFPERVNFHIVNVEGSGRLRARTWERGAGLTLACGTGACAIQATAHLLGLVEDTTQVQMPGGLLTVSWPGAGEVILEGPVEEVFEGEWEGVGGTQTA